MMYSHHSSKGTNTANKAKFKVQETLVEVDGWRLVKPLYPQIIKVASYIVHIGCQARNSKTVQGALRPMGPGGVRMGCVLCGKTPPDEIVGLEILHNGKI